MIVNRNALDEVLSRVQISDVWTALGGKRPVRGRAPAFWRNHADGLNVSLNDAKGTWFDFAGNVGGGVLDLVRLAHGCDRREALRWLADFAGVQLEQRTLTPEEKREFAKRKAQAEREAQNLLTWRDQNIEVLRAHRNELQSLYHSAERFVRAHDPHECEARGDIRWEMAFDLAYMLWPRIERLDAQIDAFQNASMEELLGQFRKSREQGVAA